MKPLASEAPLRLRSNVPSVVMSGVSLLPVSVRSVKESVPASGSVLSISIANVLDSALVLAAASVAVAVKS